MFLNNFNAGRMFIRSAFFIGFTASSKWAICPPYLTNDTSCFFQLLIYFYNTHAQALEKCLPDPYAYSVPVQC
jgi:hypothetical protein